MKTSYSRHELYALGEPLGDSVTRKVAGRVIYGGGGGGQPSETKSTVTNTNIPEYAKPYVESMLGATQRQLFKGTTDESGNFNITGFQPYKAYGGTYDVYGNQTSYDPSKGIAGFQPLQQQAQAGIQNLQMPGGFDEATRNTQQAMQGLLGREYGNQYQAPSAYQTGNFGYQQAYAPNLQDYQMGPAQQAYAPNLQDYQMGPAQQVGTQSITQPGSLDAYMNPYMQNVVDVQKREALRQSGAQGAQQQAQAASAGAFGGGRDAIMRAERERNLGTQMNDIQGMGSQAAFQNAQGQFNTEQQARMQAQLANQQAGLTVGGQNLAARLGTQQFGAGQNLQAQLANQQAGLTVGGQNLAARLGTQQFGAGQSLQAQLANQQAGMTAQQQLEQSRQYGYGQNMQSAALGAQYGLSGQQLGLQGQQAALSGANQLSNIANQRLQAQQGIYGLQNQVGAQQQQLEQQKLNQAMQDYSNQQQYPMMQLGMMSNMLRGLPMQSTSTNMYQAQPNMLTQGIGAAGSMASLYNAYNTPGKATGGAIKSMASGGITSIPRYDVGGQVMSQLEQMDDQSLAREAKESPSPEIKRMAQAILKQRQAGMDTAPQAIEAPQPQQDMGMGMAGGGIIAFANRGEVDEAEAARAKNQTDMYIQAAQQAAAERQAQEAAAKASADAPMGMGAPPRPSLMKGINAVLESVAGKVSRPAPASMMLDTTEAPAGITAARRSPRAAEFAAARNPAPAPKAGPAPDFSAETSYTGTERPPEFLQAMEEQAAAGNSTSADLLQAYYKKFPKAAVPTDSVAPAALNSIMAAAPTAPAPNVNANNIPAIDLPEFMKKEREQIVADQGKTTGTYFDQLQQEMKDRGLSNDEARQQYMKDAMASKANLQADAERTKQLRMAEFFASWGSTPGDTLVAGMSALKAKIPDMIGDIKEQRKALAEANDLIYKIGEATRQEQLGNWDKATKLKEAAAGRAEKFNERLTQYMYHVQDTVMQTQTNRANALTQAASAANVADIHGQYQIAAANITDRARKVMQDGQLDVKQQALIEKSARDVQALAEQLERNATKPGSPYANAVKIVQDAAMIPDPESPLKKKAVEAQKVIDATKAQHEKILSNAWQQSENLFKKYAGPNYVPGINPYASSTAGNHPADIKALIDQFAVPAK